MGRPGELPRAHRPVEVAGEMTNPRKSTFYQTVNQPPRIPNGNELKDAAIKLYGHKHWLVRLAADLGSNRSSVWRWANGHQPVPGPVAAAVSCWMKEKNPVSVKREYGWEKQR